MSSKTGAVVRTAIVVFALSVGALCALCAMQATAEAGASEARPRSDRKLVRPPPIPWLLPASPRSAELAPCIGAMVRSCGERMRIAPGLPVPCRPPPLLSPGSRPGAPS